MARVSFMALSIGGNPTPSAPSTGQTAVHSKHAVHSGDLTVSKLFTGRWAGQEIGKLIENYGGQPLVAPAVRAVPVEPNTWRELLSILDKNQHAFPLQGCRVGVFDAFQSS